MLWTTYIFVCPLPSLPYMLDEPARRGPRGRTLTPPSLASTLPPSRPPFQPVSPRRCRRWRRRSGQLARARGWWLGEQTACDWRERERALEPSSRDWCGGGWGWVVGAPCRCSQFLKHY
eukprot:1454369-Pleurochrysis_carterae.AAC.2